MFIELTDHLRCPADHPESYLVLIPDEVVQRSVRRGTLGCPVCRREYPIEEGVVRFGMASAEDREAGTAAGRGDPSAPIEPGALVALLGIDGPGGYVALAGEAALLGPGLVSLLPGVNLVALNPPAGVEDSARMSVLFSGGFPLKTRSLRGVVLGGATGRSAWWQREAARAVLPGRQVVGSGAGPAAEVAELELLASAGGWWVGRERT